MPWFVLYTKSRSEKLVADKLNAIGIEAYCPTIKTKRRWSDRVKMVEEPLIRSYSFVNLPENERNRVFAVPGVVRYLFWQQKPALVRDHEIEIIRRLLNDFNHESLHVDPVKPGDRLTITSGLFSYFSGEVIEHQGKVVSILLDSLQVVIKVDLSKTFVTL